MTERAGHRLFHHHLAELAHDEEGDEAADGVTKQYRGACHLDGVGNAEEQAGTYGTAQCDELDVAVFQAALELFAVLLKIHSSFLTSLNSLVSRLVCHGTSCTRRGILCRKRDEIRINIVTVCRALFFMAATNPSRIVIIDRSCTCFPHHWFALWPMFRFFMIWEGVLEVIAGFVVSWFLCY
ncbi:hypothetical protein D3C78_554480 [compost metagenome]